MWSWDFFLRVHQIIGRRDFFWKHFMEVLRWKFPQSALYEVTVPRNLMEFSFPGAHRIPRYADSCESISWKHDVIQRNHDVVILNVLFIWLKMLQCQHEWMNEWMNLLTFQHIYIFTRAINIYLRHTLYITNYLTKHKYVNK